MTLLALSLNDAIFVQNDQVRTTSLKVAEAFGRQHKNVIQKIETLECSAEFASANFSAHVQKVSIGNGANRESKYYEMTKDGFMFLVMGFTGKVAAQIKEAYINAFNAMAAQLTMQPVKQSSTDDRTGLRNAVNLLVSKKSLMYPEAYSLIHHRFGVEHLDQLTKDQLPVAIEYVHRLALEGEWLPAVPAEDKKQFTDEELNHLAWLWRAADIILTGVKDIYPLLAVAEHRLASNFLTWKREYPYTLNRAQLLLVRETGHIPLKKGGDPVLTYLRDIREIR